MPVADRIENGARHAARLRKKGRTLQPVAPSGRGRQVAHAELLTRATAALAGATPPKRGARRAIAADRLAAMLGIELETDPTPRARRPRSR